MRDGLPAAPVSRTDFAAHQDPRARTKPLEERGAEMEPEEEQRRVGVVAQQDFEPAPPVSALHLVHLGDGACDDASLAERRVGDQAGRAPVFVADGKVEENVVDGDESLPAQPLGDGRTDAAQPLHRSLESLRGHRAARRRKERGRRQRGIGRHGPFATRGLRHSREIRDFLGDRDEPPELAHEDGDCGAPLRFRRRVEPLHRCFELVEPLGLAREGPRGGDQAPDEGFEVAQGGGGAGADEETERRQQRREGERQAAVRAVRAHRASSSSVSGGYSTNSTSRISYSRSPPGARMRTVSPTSRPINPRAMGLVMLMRPFFRSASVSPTMAYWVFAPESVSSSLTVAPKTTLSPESFLTSMISARASRSSSILMRPSMWLSRSLPAWSSAFSRRSPCSGATPMSWTFFGRSTDLRCFRSRLIASAPSRVMGILSDAISSCLRCDPGHS